MKKQSAYVFKKVVVRDPKSTWHNQKVDIQVEHGVIVKIAEDIAVSDSADAVVFDKDKLLEVNVMPGWVDPHVEGGEPGFEARETLISLSKAAVHGGFTALGMMPNVKPITNTVEHLRSLQHLSANLEVNVIPHVALTDKDGGPSPVYEMRDAGAALFTNGFQAYLEEAQWITTMQYGNAAGIRTASSIYNPSLVQEGIVYDSVFSSGLGLPTIPNIAESYSIQQLLSLHEYTGGKLHLLCLTNPESVKLWEQAQKKDPGLSYAVGIPYLLYNEEALKDFDSQYKVFPPWQNSAVQKKLNDVVMSKDFMGMLTTYHQPRTIEEKQVELGYALPGMATLDYGVIDWLSEMDELDYDHLTEILSRRARVILGLDEAVIQEGSMADFTFLAQGKEKMPRKEARSSAFNVNLHSAYSKWSVEGIVVNGKFHSND